VEQQKQLAEQQTAVQQQVEKNRLDRQNRQAHAAVTATYTRWRDFPIAPPPRRYENTEMSGSSRKEQRSEYGSFNPCGSSATTPGFLNKK
jgi:hypothetical protein